MTQGLIDESKELFRIGVPAILAQLAQMSMGVIDTIMAGQVSAEALAAIAVGTNILNPIIVFVLGIFIAFNPIVAQLNGRGNFNQIGLVFQHSIWLALLLALPCAYTLWHMQPLMHLLDIQPILIPTIHEYLVACSYGIVALFLFYGLRFCNEGLFATKTIMIVTLVAIPFNIGLNYWFIWGGWGIPALGAIGVGYATSTVWLVMCLTLLGYTYYTKRYQHLNIFDRFHRLDKKQIREIFALGIPMGITVGMEIAMFAIIGLLIGSYAIHIVAAHQVAINVASLAFMVPLGLSIAITARVGYHKGKNNFLASKLAGTAGIIIASAIAIVSALLMYTQADAIVQIYTDDPAVTSVAIALLFYAAVFQISDALQVSAMGALRGIKDTHVPMWINAISYWVIGFPIGYYLAKAQGLGAEGFWIGFIAGLTAAALLLTIRFKLHRKSEATT